MIRLNLHKKPSRLLRRFARTREAVAAVEFALIVPFLMMLYMGSIEVSQVIAVDQRLAAVASTTGDLVARANGTIAASDVDDYFDASEMILAPYPNVALKQLVTCVFVELDGTTSVVWSRGYNGATAKTNGAAYPLPTEITSIAGGNYVIVSEAQMPYKPWGGYFLDQTFNLYKQYFHMPRYGELIVLS